MIKIGSRHEHFGSGPDGIDVFQEILDANFKKSNPLPGEKNLLAVLFIPQHHRTFAESILLLPLESHSNATAHGELDEFDVKLFGFANAS